MSLGIPPGSEVEIICPHGEVIAHARVLYLLSRACPSCGGAFYRCEFIDGPNEGGLGDICADALRREN